jgi:hypothetical protein
MHDIERIERELQETVEAMSADAHEAWEEIERLCEKAMASEDKPPYLDTVKTIEQMYPSAREELSEAIALKGQLLRAQAEEAAGNKSLMRQLAGSMEKAIELEPDLEGKNLTVGEALKVLERHGVKHGISPEVLEMEMEVTVRPEEWGEQFSTPVDEVPTDENGIPLRSATPHGFTFVAADGKGICLDALEAEAMRVLGQHRTFENYVEEMPEEQVSKTQRLRQDAIELLTGTGLPGDKAEEQADEVVYMLLRLTYLEILAVRAKEEPEVQGMIDLFRGENTAAARRFAQRIVRSFMGPIVDEFLDEKIAEGEIVRSFDEDGKEILKVNEEHPEYQRRQRELREKMETLSPERRKIFEALQDEKRGKHRMNEHAAMHTVEELSDEEVSELQYRIRRIRRGLDVQ